MVFDDSPCSLWNEALQDGVITDERRSLLFECKSECPQLSPCIALHCEEALEEFLLHGQYLDNV